MLAVSQNRVDLPTGAVPSYSKFLRSVWGWKNEDGRQCLEAPPWMYSIVVRDRREIDIVSSVLSTCDGHFEIRMADGGLDFAFGDLRTLHTFLCKCAALGVTNETARHVCEYVMWTLGFRWV